MKSILKISFLFLLVSFFFGCSKKYTPKPRGYFRIDFPQKQYLPIYNEFPYRFEIPVYSEIEKDKFNPDKKEWVNVSIPANKAEIHISYYDLTGQTQERNTMLNKFLEETRELAYKHTIKADAIQEQLFVNPEANVYGLIYRIEGNAASPLQFYLTDSTRHFLRGSLYIRDVPDIDSLRPVIDFLVPDVIHLIETTTWN